jgi:hypothetical protein
MNATSLPAEWTATIRIETWNVSGSRRPGAGTSELVMEAGGLMFTKDEWDRGVAATGLRYGRLSNGYVASHGRPVQGFVYGADENVSEWNRW